MYMHAKNSTHSSIVNAVLCLYWFLVYKTVLDIGFQSISSFITVSYYAQPHFMKKKIDSQDLIFLDLFN